MSENLKTEQLYLRKVMNNYGKHCDFNVKI